MSRVQVVIAALEADVLRSPVSSPRARLDDLKQAIVRAYRALGQAAGRTPGMRAAPLKVFLAPEYYFARKMGTGGSQTQDGFDPGAGADEPEAKRRKIAYGKDEYDLIRSELSNVSRQCGGMLIVPGSILWKEWVFAKAIRRKVAGTRSAVRNTAFVLYDGEVVLTYDKRADADELKANPRLLHLGDPADSYTFEKGTLSGVFTVGGLRCGLEICADHGKLRSDLGENDLLDLQLLISAGMTATPGNVRIKPGGKFVQCDGADPANGIGLYRRVPYMANFKLERITDASPGLAHPPAGMSLFKTEVDT